MVGINNMRLIFEGLLGGGLMCATGFAELLLRGGLNEGI